MAGIVSSGVGSGMDFESIIMASIKSKQQMISRPVTVKKEETNIKISGVGTLKGALEDFEKSLKDLSDGSAFNQRKVTSDQSDTNPFFTVSPGKDASNMSHDVVVKQLASSEKVSKSFDNASGFNNSFEKGTLTIKTGKKDDQGKDIELKVEIDEGDNLEIIRKKINKNDLGITANIIKTDKGYELSVDSGKTGEDSTNNLTISVTSAGATPSGKDSLSALAFDKTNNANSWNHTEGKDAIIELDGKEIKSKTNEFDTQISGITLTVNRVSEKDSGGAFKSNHFDLTEDSDAVAKKVEDFVNAYNTLQSKMNQLYKHNTYKDGVNQYDGGDLAGDSTLKGLQTMIKEKISTFGNISGGKSIFDMGIEFTKDGSLEFNKSDFTEALKDNYNSVVNAFSGEKGLVKGLEESIKNYTKSDGILDNMNNQLQADKRKYEAKETANAEYLEKYEASLRKKYGSLDKLLAGYNNSLSYIQGLMNF